METRETRGGKMLDNLEMRRKREKVAKRAGDGGTRCREIFSVFDELSIFETVTDHSR
jgi:hypothetical protein